jgi:2-oxoglutarate dehydrogenase E1 component
LRNKAASSPMEAFVEGGFLPVIGECEDVDRANVSRILVCSGKIYYDLIKARAERKRKDVAIIRIEQLYPFPEDKLGKELEKYSFADEIVWVQDEPQNQGPWNYAHSKVLAQGTDAVLCRTPGVLFAGGRLRSPPS